LKIKSSIVLVLGRIWFETQKRLLAAIAALAFDFGLGKSWSVFSYEILKKHRVFGRAGQS
jgi:hypothetical protein